MDFIGGALPNVMFLIGAIAIGIGLGLEFKIIEVKNGLSRGGRIGACIVGVALITTSIALYLRPQQTGNSVSQVVAAVSQEGASIVPTQLPAPSSSLAEPEAATATPTAAPTETPTATPLPSSTPTPEPTTIPVVAVPDIRGMSAKDAEKALAQVGLQLGERQPSCEELGVDAELVLEVRKDRVACQSLTPGSNAPLGSTVTYALSDGKGD